jgi:hypothetical protein
MTEDNDEVKASDARKALVKELCEMVRADKDHWEYAFTRMKEWRRFARGLQWPGSDKKEMSDADREYVANVTMRHLKQRTSSIYAKNPNYHWRRTKRLTSKIWDGTASQLKLAMMMVQQGGDTTGMYASIVQDAIMTRGEAQAIERVGETLTCAYSYFIGEQNPPMKKMAKKQVMASLTCGVAYFKQTFQRIMDHPPETISAIADHTAQLAIMTRLAEELSEGELAEYEPDIERLRLLLNELQSNEKIVLREGLSINYPDSTNIIPDKNLTYLPGFVGCDHVTEQYCLTKDQVHETYGVDVSEGAVVYQDNEQSPAKMTVTSKGKSRETVRVWEIWDRAENLVYVVCDGYEDFLREPTSPITYTERFFPWFVYAPNALDDDEDPFPPSDVELMMCQQQEINRAGEGLRQHRWASRPSWVAGGNIPEDDANAIQSRAAHSITILKSLAPEEDINKKLQAFPTAGIDPALYNTQPAFADILRSVGTQEANLGGTSGATATETGIAESSRQSTLSSAIDEFDDLLTEMARAGGQILLQEMTEEKIKEIVGPGAVWPQQSREQIAKELALEAVAGSSGRPNQAQQVAVMERLYPLLFQLPGIKAEKLIQHGLRILDDTVIYEDWIDMDLLPITAVNGQMQAGANRGAMNDPASQGGNGANNAPQPPGPGPGAPQPGQAGFGTERPNGQLPM